MNNDIDVPNLPFSQDNSSDYFNSLSLHSISIGIPRWTCNDTTFTDLDFSRFTSVVSIEIDNDCFGSVQTFTIDGLSHLKTIKIGNNSFTQKKNYYGNNVSKSFHILNCESLVSIRIGEYSFSDFGGEFELKNLPQLRSIQIGAIGWRSDSRYGIGSSNFRNSSFVVRRIELILKSVMIRSSKSTIHYLR